MTTATKAGGAVLPVVGYVNTDDLGRLLDPTDCAMIVTTQSGWSRTALTPHAPAQATIDELRAEVIALKAKQIDVDAVMRLAEDYAQSVSTVDLANGEVWRSAEYRAKRVAESDAAREALRAELTKDRT